MRAEMMAYTDPKSKPSRRNAVACPTGVKEHREKILATITTHDALSRRGLWGMLIFIVISFLVLQLRNMDVVTQLPENVRDILGTPPPPELVHVVLAVSTISSIIVILGQVMGEENPCGSWKQVWFSLGIRSIFYLFYASANALEENFLIVFAAGIVVLALEHFTSWHYAATSIEKEKELLAQIK